MLESGGRGGQELLQMVVLAAVLVTGVLLEVIAITMIATPGRQCVRTSRQAARYLLFGARCLLLFIHVGGCVGWAARPLAVVVCIVVRRDTVTRKEIKLRASGGGETSKPTVVSVGRLVLLGVSGKSPYH